MKCTPRIVKTVLRLKMNRRAFYPLDQLPSKRIVIRIQRTLPVPGPTLIKGRRTKAVMVAKHCAVYKHTDKNIHATAKILLH